MTRQRFVDRQSARAACAVPFLGTRPVRPVGRDPFRLSSCPARRADRGGHPREVSVHRPRAARSACAAHTRSCIFYSSNTLRGSPLDALTANATWATPPGVSARTSSNQSCQDQIAGIICLLAFHGGSAPFDERVEKNWRKLGESRDALERALHGRRGGRSLNPQPPCLSIGCGSGARRPPVGSRPGWDSAPVTGGAGGGDATGPPMGPVGGGTRTPDSTRPESVCR